MSGSALEGGAVFEGEDQAAIRVGRSVVQQAAPELFTEVGELAILLFEDRISLCRLEAFALLSTEYDFIIDKEYRFVI